MLRFYDYIFYRRYTAGTRGGAHTFLDSWAAFGTIGILIILNIFGTLLLIKVITGVGILDYFSSLPRWGQIVIWIAIAIFVMLRWGTERRIGQILAEFEDMQETNQQKIIRAIGIWIYALAWFALIIVCMLVLNYRK